MMKHQEGNFDYHNNQSIYYQAWLPEGKSKASLFIVHGLHEHSARYKHVAAYLVDHGYALYSLDFPGHGKSDGMRSYIDSYLDFINIMEIYLEKILSWQPNQPIFLVGHSMGGLLSAVFLTDSPSTINGAILSGSLVQVPDYVSDLTIRVGKILSRILPKVRLVEIDKEGLSKDPAVVQAYRDDPLVYNGKTTARISNELNNAITQVEKNGSNINQPLLLLHGADDRICDPAWSQYLFDMVSSQDKQLIIYEGLYHEIYNEPEAATVFNDVLRWLEEHTS
jgi:alpha-beta hydrolase superfamily lysophospholipase